METIPRSSSSPSQAYQPGVCNIGPAEIRARRRSGHIGLALTVVGLAVLVALDVPAPWRLVLFLPAAAAASGYLQAAFHFCANFGMRGVFNFGGRLGQVETIEEAEARAADRRKALQIIGLSALIGLAVAIGAAALPV